MIKICPRKPRGVIMGKNHDQGSKVSVRKKTNTFEEPWLNGDGLKSLGMRGFFRLLKWGFGGLLIKESSQFSE